MPPLYQIVYISSSEFQSMSSKFLKTPSSLISPSRKITFCRSSKETGSVVLHELVAIQTVTMISQNSKPVELRSDGPYLFSGQFQSHIWTSDPNYPHPMSTHLNILSSNHNPRGRNSITALSTPFPATLQLHSPLPCPINTSSSRLRESASSSYLGWLWRLELLAVLAGLFSPIFLLSIQLLLCLLLSPPGYVKTKPISLFFNILEMCSWSLMMVGGMWSNWIIESKSEFAIWGVIKAISQVIGEGGIKAKERSPQN